MYSAAQPVGDLPDSDLFDEPRRPAGRVPGARSELPIPIWPSRAMLMAGLDGIQRKIEPPQPIDEDLYELHDERKTTIKTVPGSLVGGARRAGGRSRLPARRATSSRQDVLETWITMKRTKDVAPVNAAAASYEFFLYYDA